MGFNEVRKDYILNRWAVIATERGRRPTDFAKQERQRAKSGVCPMDPGNEHLTPPAVLVYLKSGKTIRKTKDSDGARQKNWLIRVVPNLYPAFQPPKEELSQKQIMKSNNLRLAVGHHEVLIESPNHDEHVADARISQLTHVINGYIDRLRYLSARPYVRYVSIFRNHGLEAGASLSHAHSQIVAMPFTPGTVQQELEASKNLWEKQKRCPFCNILENELRSPRRILENQDFAAFTAYAGIQPMEFWIIPKKHATTPLTMSQDEIKQFSQTLKTCLKALKQLVNDPPYNYGFHLTLDKEAEDYYHWHLEVYPKLSVWAGFELATGTYINTMSPEVAAESFRKAISP